MAVATIDEIMESWPLGLRLRLETGEDGEPEELMVDLSEECRIFEGDRALAPGDLRGGMRVRFDAAMPGPLRQLEVLGTASVEPGAEVVEWDGD